MKTIDINKPVTLRLEGLTRGKWITITDSEANVPDDLSYDDKLERLDEGLDQLCDLFNQCYKEGANGYIQLGNTSVAIHRFDALRVNYIQDGEVLPLPEKD